MISLSWTIIDGDAALPAGRFSFFALRCAVGQGLKESLVVRQSSIALDFMLATVFYGSVLGKKIHSSLGSGEGSV